MSLPSVSPELLRAGNNRFLSRFIPMLGISLSEMDYLRGRRDDFLGNVIADQYTVVSNGAGSGGALGIAHGGNYRLVAGAGIGFYHYLWLGDAAGTHATLDAGIGWVMMARMAISHTTNMYGDFGVNVPGVDTIMAGFASPDVANNWRLVTRTAAGAPNIVNSGIAVDTNPHWHVLTVYPITGGLRQADYLLDGAQIATTSVSMPTVVMTPIVRCYAVAAAARNLDLDTWITIPRNLV